MTTTSANDRAERLREKAHERIQRNKKRVLSHLEKLVRRSDPVEVLSQVAMMAAFAPRDETPRLHELRDRPVVPLLTGICLKLSSLDSTKPALEEVSKIVDLTVEYLKLFSLGMALAPGDASSSKESEALIVSARLQALITQINPSIYSFELETLVNGVFGPFAHELKSTLGFDAAAALSFARAIQSRYERRLNDRIDSVGHLREAAEQLLKSKTATQVRDVLSGTGITDEEVLTSYATAVGFASTRAIFEFSVDEFLAEEGVADAEAFRAYVRRLSCEFSKANGTFSSPLDTNAITSTPLIHTGESKYFAPISSYLTVNLPAILEDALRPTQDQDTRVWERYQKRKAEFTEQETAKYLAKIFPGTAIHRNLRYRFHGRQYETDILFAYDNKLFVVECKAGGLTAPARRGAIDRLKTDLRKLVEDAYEQGRRVREYVKSEPTSVFTDSRGRPIVEISFTPGRIDFVLISVTLEPLLSFNSALKQLQAVGLFHADEFPWSVYLFELDIIAKHVPSPTVFIHYLENRLSTQVENIIHTFDELTYFGYYLEYGHLQLPHTTDDEARAPDMAVLADDWIGRFDEHYLYGEEAPTLQIDERYAQLVAWIERMGFEGFSRVTSVLLDFAKGTREDILKYMIQAVERAAGGRGRSDFTLLFATTLDLGFTFIADSDGGELGEFLQAYCNAKKYQARVTRWLGLAKDTRVKNTLVDHVVYANYAWESDRVMDDVLEKLNWRPYDNGFDDELDSGPDSPTSEPPVGL